MHPFVCPSSQLILPLKHCCWLTDHCTRDQPPQNETRAGFTWPGALANPNLSQLSKGDITHPNRIHKCFTFWPWPGLPGHPQLQPWISSPIHSAFWEEEIHNACDQRASFKGCTIQLAGSGAGSYAQEAEKPWLKFQGCNHWIFQLPHLMSCTRTAGVKLDANGGGESNRSFPPPSHDWQGFRSPCCSNEEQSSWGWRLSHSVPQGPSAPVGGKLCKSSFSKTGSSPWMIMGKITYRHFLTGFCCCGSDQASFTHEYFYNILPRVPTGKEGSGVGWVIRGVWCMATLQPGETQPWAKERSSDVVWRWGIVWWFLSFPCFLFQGSSWKLHSQELQGS